MRRVLLSACLAIAAPAQAQSDGESQAAFRIGGAEIIAPMPQGLCMPEGINADVAQILAAGDKDNVTHLTLFRCEGKAEGQDYVLVKTPATALTTQIGRAELLTAMGAEFENPETVAAVSSKEVVEKAGDTFTQMLDTKVDFSGAIGPRGKDDVCAYLAGTIDVTAHDKTNKISVAVCLTSVGNRIVSVNWYAPDSGPAGIAELARKARTFALSMKAPPAK